MGLEGETTGVLPSRKVGVLLINIGTPEAPTAKAVGEYLREFLMDPCVMDIPFPLRWILVNWVIVPLRSQIVASQYKTIWTRHGSPLLVISELLRSQLQKELGENYIVELGMRYGHPSLSEAIEKCKADRVSDLIACPLYPQYSLAATESAMAQLKKLNPTLPLKFLPPFYNEPYFLEAFAEVAYPFIIQKGFDKVIFSFHGLPQRHIKKTENKHGFCRFTLDCCEKITDDNKNCYRAQCYFTAREIALRLGLSTKDYVVAFQSRLGMQTWIRPFTDELYRRLPSQGIQRVLVICPSFVADCLETLEEVVVRGKRLFQENGGESLELVPSINTHPKWVQGLGSWIRNSRA